ncbi:unnamed protein product, partial [Urochloa humidicola]
MAGNSITQFGTHDCGLFTILAIQHWDGRRFPGIIGYDDSKLRKDVLFQIINNSVNKVDWRDVLNKMKH